MSSRRSEPIPPGLDPATRIEELRQRAATDGVHSTALAIDPRNWELVQFTLWEDTARESAGTRYRVLHLSTPELGELHAGRHW